MTNACHARFSRVSMRTLRGRDAVRISRCWRRAAPRQRKRSAERAAALPARALQPEHRLRVAVLEEALRVLMDADAFDRHAVRGRAAEARDWVLCDDTTWPFSFRSVCDALDIDADGLRRRLTPWLSPHRSTARRDGQLSAEPPPRLAHGAPSCA